MLVAGCIFASLFASIVNAAPGLELHSKRQSIAVLSQGQITAFRPFTYFAGAAYCDSSTTIDWSCGRTSLSFFPFPSKTGQLTDRLYLRPTANCAANSDFIITASGGDGNAVQFCKYSFFSLNMNDNLTMLGCDEGYVGFSPSQATVIVAHQGTNLLALLV